jgi:hypothetical protein
MKFRIHENLGEGRWHCTAWSESGHEDLAFRTWMDERYPDCLYQHRFNGGEPYWEIRGGDKRILSLILLRWDTGKGRRPW